MYRHDASGSRALRGMPTIVPPYVLVRYGESRHAGIGISFTFPASTAPPYWTVYLARQSGQSIALTNPPARSCEIDSLPGGVETPMRVGPLSIRQ